MLSRLENNKYKFLLNFIIMNKFYTFLLLGLLASLSVFSQAEVEPNDYFGETTTISSVGTLTGTTDVDWQGDTWYLDFEPGEYQVTWTADASTRVRVIEYVGSFNPVVDDENNTPGASSDCTFANPYSGCFLIDNKETLSDDISETFTIGAENHFILFLNPHMATELDYSITFSLVTDIDDNVAQKGISIYPNPATDVVTINAESNTHIKIVDITGKVLIEQTLLEESSNINIDNLPSGMYFIVSDSQTLKFIKE